MAEMLTENELDRYSRQLLLPELGEEGQRKLKSSHVVIAGIGGLGCSSSMQLACAGVGHITIIDDEFVELSNLNRQFHYWEEDIGEKKTVIAQRKLSKLNPTIEVTPIFAKITEENVFDLIKEAQIVVDGMDNFPTRFILNSACVNKKIPFIYAGVYGLSGMTTTIIPGLTPCLACLYPKTLEMERPFPVLGVAPSLMANLQAMETIKLIVGLKPSFAGKLLMFKGDSGEFSTVSIKRRANCKVCHGDKAGEKEATDDESSSNNR